MPFARNGKVEICYDTFGSPDDPALMFVSGFGSQMIARPDEFCEAAAARGFYFIRFDNRDVGLSTKCEGIDYTLSDMASDAIAVLDDLDIDAANVVGMSMGGMIAQTLAVEHPGRVLSLVSLMSHMSADVVAATPEAQAIFMVPAPTTRDEAIERLVHDRRVIGSPGFEFDEAEVRELGGLLYDRSNYPDGRIRQALAIQKAAPRAEALGKLDIPVTVIHGTDDPLIPVENGRRTAAAIPGAKLVLIEGMGHDLPRGTWEQILDAVASTAHRNVPA